LGRLINNIQEYSGEILSNITEYLGTPRNTWEYYECLGILRYIFAIFMNIEKWLGMLGFN